MKNTSFHQLEKALESLFAEALDNEVFSGAAAAVVLNKKGDKKRLITSYGRTRNDEKGKKVNEDTLFDLASLTKPLCTTLCIISLIENEKLKFSSELKSLIKYKTKPDLKKIRVENLLSHSSGLTDYRPFFIDFAPCFSNENKTKIIEKILQESLAYKTAQKCLYSDLGFILLGEIVEQVSGKKLHTYFGEKITGPLKLDKSLFFIPLIETAERGNENIAATEICPWRKRLLQGEVHDEHCWLMGGVAGHAGLFGTAAGVIDLAEHIFLQWQGRERYSWCSDNLLRQALEKIYPGETWAMGFDRPAPEQSSAGRYISRKSVGHLGYTGTSFWIDPERELVVVLLTNRVYPTRKNEKIKQFRPLFHDTVIESLHLQ